SIQLSIRGGDLHAEGRLHITTSKGSISVDKGKLIVANADKATLTLVGASNFVNYGDVSAQPARRVIDAMNGIKGVSYDDLRAAHVRDYRKYYERMSIRLGDEQLTSKIPTDLRLKRFAAG